MGNVLGRSHFQGRAGDEMIILKWMLNNYYLVMRSILLTHVGEWISGGWKLNLPAPIIETVKQNIKA
jgi:hypothetical protein